jgi:hypothetical protein
VKQVLPDLDHDITFDDTTQMTAANDLLKKTAFSSSSVHNQGDLSFSIIQEEQLPIATITEIKPKETTTAAGKKRPAASTVAVVDDIDEEEMLQRANKKVKKSGNVMVSQLDKTQLKGLEGNGATAAPSTKKSRKAELFDDLNDDDEDMMINDKEDQQVKKKARTTTDEEAGSTNLTSKGKPVENDENKAVNPQRDDEDYVPPRKFINANDWVDVNRSLGNIKLKDEKEKKKGSIAAATEEEQGEIVIEERDLISPEVLSSLSSGSSNGVVNGKGKKTVKSSFLPSSNSSSNGIKNVKKFIKNEIRKANPFTKIKNNEMEKVLPKESEREIQVFYCL